LTLIIDLVVICFYKKRLNGGKMKTISKLLLAISFAISVTTSAFAVTAVSWGGAYTESQKLGYGDPTAKELGIEINWVDYSGGLSEIKAQKEAGAITWDIIDVFAMDTINGCDEGLFVEFDFDKDFPSCTRWNSCK
jgi:putative spermidine/putrescine transport system substrate-binding protein